MTSRRFDYVKYDETAAAEQAGFKELFSGLAGMVEDRLSPGRATSLALTKLEEAYMWVGKALRDECIARDDKVPDEPRRTNE